MNLSINNLIDRHINVVKELSKIESDIIAVGESIIRCLKKGNKIIIAGNGGSASDAQHFAAELTGRFIKNRESLAGISLATDTSAITAIANDYGYENIFKRQLSGIVNVGDIFLGITTSGNSPSINNAFKLCKEKEITSIGLLGKDGGKSFNLTNSSVIVPSQHTENIQECHILIIHIWCNMIDDAF